MPESTPQTRLEAARILSDWSRTGLFPNRMIPDHIPDRALLTELVYGAIKEKRLLDWIASRCSHRHPQPDILPFLWVGLYQLFRMDNIPPHAAVFETVEAVKQSPWPDSAGYVNGILRRALREGGDINAEMKKIPFAVRFSHPDILVERWKALFNPKQTRALCDWNNRRATTTAHPALNRISMDDFIALCKKEGVEILPLDYDFVLLPRGTRVSAIPGYTEGLFSIHDPSTREAVRLLNPRPGQHILDACAAPGGKTLLIAEKMQDQGRLVAMDPHEDRLITLRENMTRMRLPWVEVVQGDAASAADLQALGAPQGFDGVLLDVPCTNTGVLRRRADARWRFTPERLAQRVEIQTKLLDNASRFVKPGGTLVYSTCSLEPEENTGLIHAWLKKNPEFTHKTDKQLFPPESGTDGIYAACLIRSPGAFFK